MPKGAMVSHTYSYLGGYSFALTHTRGLRIECDLKLVTFLPLIFHIADQIMRFPAFLCGGTLVMGRRFDPARIAAAIADERVTACGAARRRCSSEVTERSRPATATLDASLGHAIVYGWTAIAPTWSSAAASAPGTTSSRSRSSARPRRSPATASGPTSGPRLFAGHRAGGQLRRRARTRWWPATSGRRGGQLAARDGRESRARSSTARRSSPPATTRTRRPPRRPSAAAGFTPATSAVRRGRPADHGRPLQGHRSSPAARTSRRCASRRCSFSTRRSLKAAVVGPAPRALGRGGDRVRGPRRRAPPGPRRGGRVLPRAAGRLRVPKR